jgi:hypothetical protein
MAASQPRHSKEKLARRGDELYERDLRPDVEAGHAGKFIVIAIDTDALLVSDRPLARHPDAQVWLRRIGARSARRFGTCSPKPLGNASCRLRQMSMPISSPRVSPTP